MNEKSELNLFSKHSLKKLYKKSGVKNMASKLKGANYKLKLWNMYACTTWKIEIVCVNLFRYKEFKS